MIHADLALARRLEAAEVSNTSSCAAGAMRDRPGCGAGILHVAGGAATSLGPSFPFNSVKGIGLHAPLTPDDVRLFEAFFLERGGGNVTVDVCPLADPSVWNVLCEHGYRLAEFESVLVREVTSHDLHLIPIPGLNVTRATPNEARLWSTIMARGFTDQTEPPEWMVDLGVFMGDASEMFMLWARIDGEIASASGMRIVHGVATGCGTATLPHMRGRGAQTALVRERLRMAASAGCDLVKIDTKPGSISQRNIERAGFTIAYTRAQVTKTLAVSAQVP
jgi:GNAT superfamily N-acetyltransferase